MDTNAATRRFDAIVLGGGPAGEVVITQLSERGMSLARSKAKDLGTFDMKLAPCADFAGGNACVASQNRLYQVDIATGKIVRAVICDQTIQNVGCINSNRAFVQNGGKVAIVDFTAGKTVQTVDLGKEVRHL